MALHAIRNFRESVVNSLSQLCNDSILKSFDVDDFVGGVNFVEEAVKQYQDILATLASIGMQIRKRTTNSELIMQSMPIDLP